VTLDTKASERAMITSILRATFRAPFVASLLIAIGAAIGALWLQDLKRDVFPDLSAPVFNVIAQNPAMGAEELETAIATPLEVELAGRATDPLQLPVGRRTGHDRVRTGRGLLPVPAVRR
jgi:hypothetical protein